MVLQDETRFFEIELIFKQNLGRCHLHANNISCVEFTFHALPFGDLSFPRVIEFCVVLLEYISPSMAQTISIFSTRLFYSNASCQVE